MSENRFYNVKDELFSTGGGVVVEAEPQKNKKFTAFRWLCLQ